MGFYSPLNPFEITLSNSETQTPRLHLFSTFYESLLTLYSDTCELASLCTVTAAVNYQRLNQSLLIITVKGIFYTDT